MRTRDIQSFLRLSFSNTINGAAAAGEVGSRRSSWGFYGDAAPPGSKARPFRGDSGRSDTEKRASHAKLVDIS